ncbi:hypothetical protein NP493_6327g00000 [Ridgeia piscesae]|uniref:C2 domain-containing protein n=1 Tax=Ridgeia piscesae TaxID=27915 RepID=A0AAD9IT51_RIDPI|nr:hypothetical protein NP493_6327g00000 [Ridgeia piscesae]
MGVKIGFIPKRADLVSLHIKVQYASHLPTMKDGGRNDMFVTVSLGPNTLFPFNRPMRTRVVYATSNPVFRISLVVRVLCERCQHDKVANALVKHRQATTGGGRALCAPMHFLSSMCGNIQNVKHMFS